jgi:chromosome segregation ATPase
MKKLLKQITLKGAGKGVDLSHLEGLEKTLEDVKIKLRDAKKEVSEAKQKLNIALKESLTKIEDDIKKIQNNKESKIPESNYSFVFGSEQIKASYSEKIAQLELRKNEIKKAIDEYNSDGSDRWDTAINNLNHDLAELGKALKDFATHTDL